jgi:hypothetical protein
MALTVDLLELINEGNDRFFFQDIRRPCRRGACPLNAVIAEGDSFIYLFLSAVYYFVSVCTLLARRGRKKAVQCPPSTEKFVGNTLLDPK